MTQHLYKIGEFANRLNITTRTVRYYDQLGLLPQVKRSSGGVRLFDNDDIEIIKKVRHLQQKKLLSLEEIKHQLFESETTSITSVAILTDDACILPDYNPSICTVLPLQAHLNKPLPNTVSISIKELWDTATKKQVIPYFHPPNKEDIISILHTLADNNIQSVFAIASSTAFPSLYTLYETLSYSTDLPVTLYPINSTSFGPGTGLLIDYIQTMISQQKPLSEITLGISKMIPLIYQIGFTQSLETFQSLNAMTNYPIIIDKLQPFCPIYTIKDGQGELTVTQCLPSYNEALTYLYNAIDDLITQRKKYLYKIVISYSFFYSESALLCNQLRQTYPDAEIILSELPVSATTLLGPKSINITVM